jgi:lysophospholipase L1-like esterase
MIARRFAAFGAAIAVVVGLSACTAIGQLGTPDPNVSNARIFSYTAIAASDGVGVGSSSPCTTAPVVIGSDTELMPSPVDCPGGKSYVPDIAGLLTTNRNSVILTDLGISGAVIGPDIRAIGNTYEPLIDPTCGHPAQPVCVPGDFISDELPVLPSQATTVTIFAGGNDVNAIFAGAAVIAGNGGDPTSFIATEIGAFLIDYQTLLGAVHQKFPFARIYTANLPNFGLIPRGVALGGSAQALLDAISTSVDFNQPPNSPPHGINVDLPAAGIPVIDLECDPRSYDPANFSADGFHPNDAGYRILASAFVTPIRNFGAPPPAVTCPPFSQSQSRHPFGGKIRHIRLLRY